MLETLMMGLLANTLKVAIENNGESDGVCDVLYLNGFNNVVDLDGHTDLLSLHLGLDGNISVLVAKSDDSSQVFCDLYDLPMEIVRKIVEQVTGLAQYSQE